MRFRFWASAFYFAFFAAGGSFGPFINAHYQKIGIPVEQIGLLAALPMLMIVLGNPIWSLAADAFHLHGRMLPLTMLLTLPFVWLLTRMDNFWSLAVVAVVYAFCFSPVLSLGDYAIVRGLGERADEYGRVRIWGAVGYGAAAWFGGALIEQVGLEWGVFVYIGMMAFGAFVATRLPAPRLAQGVSLRESLRVLSLDRRWYSFLGAALMAGLGFTVINNYLVLYMKELGSGEALFGFSVALAGVSELPIFFFSANLIRKWSARGLLGFALAALALRLLLISLFHDPWLVILAQLLHGVTFSAMWAAGVNYANQIAPPGLGTSSQALFSTTLFGLAGMLGASLGGLLYHSLGAVALFRLAALVVLAGWLLFHLTAPRAAPPQPAAT